MAKPVRPVAPPRALRSEPETFSANAEGEITYQFDTLPNWMNALADFTDDRADDALAAALAGDLPPITGRAGNFLRVKSDETGAELINGDNLTAVAGLATSGLVARTGAGTAATRSIAVSGLATIANADAVAGNPTVGVPAATQAEAEASTDNTKVMTPLRVKQAIGAMDIAMVPYDIKEFRISGTWTKPSDALDTDVVVVKVVGGGASGGRNVGFTNVLGGQGAAAITAQFSMDEMLASIPVVVGAGGPARTGAPSASSAGGNSSFGTSGTKTFILAEGGNAGARGAIGSTEALANRQILGGAGGSGLSLGRDGVNGGAGGGGGCQGDRGSRFPGGISTMAGNGGTGRSSNPILADGFFPGGGGGAGSNNSSRSGAGGDGLVLVASFRRN